MRNEAAHRDRAAVAGRGDQHHLGHRLFFDVAQVHGRAHGKADLLDPILERAVLVQRIAILIAGDADILRLHDDAWHAIVDQGGAHALYFVHRIAAGQQRATGGAGGVAKFKRHGRSRAGHAVDPSAAVIADGAAGRLHRGDGDLAGIFHEDGDAGFAVLRRHQAALDREGADAREDVAAILRVADDRLVDEDLKEEIIDIDARPIRFPDDRDLAGERICAAHAIDLARVGRAHHPQQEGVARGRVDGQVFGKEIAALGRAAAHPHHARLTMCRHLQLRSFEPLDWLPPGSVSLRPPCGRGPGLRYI